MNRKVFIGLQLATLFLANVSIGAAQQPMKIPRIGFLSGSGTSSQSSPDGNIAAFRQGLHDLGYIEGKNIIIEYRGAGGRMEHLPELVAELIGLGVSVIVTTGMPAVMAAKKATSTIPTVTASADNLVEAGIVASLAYPGGNVTGTTRVDADFSAKRLELLKESFPKLSRVAVLSHGSMGGDGEELQEIQTSARKLKIQVQPFPTPDPSQFPSAFADMTKKRADALIFLGSSFITLSTENSSSSLRLRIVCRPCAQAPRGSQPVASSLTEPRLQNCPGAQPFSSIRFSRARNPPISRWSNRRSLNS
jgi:putative ABC transport system substrate-binding protein